LGDADAIIFGGGIAENTTFVREHLGEGLVWFGLDIEANKQLIDLEERLSTSRSRITSLVIPVEKGLRIAHECHSRSPKRPPELDLWTTLFDA
jgi:acetate kinase